MIDYDSMYHVPPRSWQALNQFLARKMPVPIVLRAWFVPLLWLVILIVIIPNKPGSTTQNHQPVKICKKNGSFQQVSSTQIFWPAVNDGESHHPTARSRFFLAKSPSGLIGSLLLLNFRDKYKAVWFAPHFALKHLETILHPTW